MRGFHYSSILLAVRRIAIGGILLGAMVSLLFGGTDVSRPLYLWLLCFWTGLQLLFIRARSNEGGPLLACWARWLEIAAGNVALTLILAEGLLRAVASASGTLPIVSDALSAHRLEPGRDYGAGLRGNQLGYPESGNQAGAQPLNRIAALGDSFAVGPAVPFAVNYLTLLQHQIHPSCEVLNFGVAGTGPREYALILRQDVWPCHPDLVLVSIFVGNDITEELATPRKMDPRQSYLYLLVTRGSRLLREQWRRAGEPQRAEGDRLTAGQMSQAAYHELEARRLAVCLPSAAPSLEKKWLRALGYLERIVHDCRHHRVPVAFVLIPDEFQVNPRLLEEVAALTGNAAETIDVELPQRRLSAFFEQHGVPCLDLLPEFRGTIDAYALRDSHWNERGNRLAAEKISRFLEKEFPAPKGK